LLEFVALVVLAGVVLLDGFDAESPFFGLTTTTFSCFFGSAEGFEVALG